MNRLRAEFSQANKATEFERLKVFLTADKSGIAYAEVARDFDNATHRPLGPVVCISPWNFPLAICVGMTAAAVVTGNTVVDALASMPHREHFDDPVLESVDWRRHRVVLVTVHRRESLGDHLHDLCRAFKRLVEDSPEVHLVFPVHLNPRVREVVFAELRDIGMAMGFKHVESGPLVRSSYHAWEQVQAAGV